MRLWITYLYDAHTSRKEDRCLSAMHDSDARDLNDLYVIEKVNTIIFFPSTLVPSKSENLSIPAFDSGDLMKVYVYS